MAYQITKNNFEALVNSFAGLSELIEDVVEKEYGVEYTYNGIIVCCALYHNGKFYDVQDAYGDFVNKPFEFLTTSLEKFNSFSCLEHLVERIADDMKEEIGSVT